VETVEIGVRGAELGRDVGRGVALERVELGEQPGAASVAIFGQRADGRVDADPSRGAGDPVLVSFVGPVVGEVADGLVEGIGDGIDGGLVAGAGQGDVGELAAAALGGGVGAVARRTFLAVHGQGVAVVQVQSVEDGAGEGDVAAFLGLEGEGSGPWIDGDDAAAFAGDRSPSGLGARVTTGSPTA
jgi:hypothetical protein